MSGIDFYDEFNIFFSVFIQFTKVLSDVIQRAESKRKGKVHQVLYSNLTWPDAIYTKSKNTFILFPCNVLTTF